MDINIAVGAGRRLSIDVANLSFRLAMLESERDSMAQLAGMLTPGEWRHSMQAVPKDDSGDAIAATVTMTEVEQVLSITGDQIMALEQLLAMFHDLV